jgi:lipopolysaccharide assembly protein A
MPRAAYILIGALAFLLGAVVVAVNEERLRVDVLFTEIELSTGQWLVIAFVIGWVAGVFSAWRFVRRLTLERADLRRNLRLAEAELRNLRAVPHDGA